MSNLFKIQCPKCDCEITFKSSVLWFEKAVLECLECHHSWIACNFNSIPDDQTDEAMYERGKKLFDDIIIPD